MSADSLTETEAEELIETAQNQIDGNLRSLTYFTEEDAEQLYLRDYLEANADVESFAAAERPGFVTQVDDRNTELGTFEFTIRVFNRGYLVSVLGDDRGVFVTADAVELERFEALGEALTETLEEITGE